MKWIAAVNALAFGVTKTELRPLAAGRRRVRGGGHSGSHSAKAVQEVQQAQVEEQEPQETMGPYTEHPTPCCHHHSRGLCGRGYCVVSAVGVYM